MIASLMKGIGAFKKKESDLFYEEKSHFLNGSLADVLLLTPEEFSSTYHGNTELEKKPSSKIMSIIQYVYAHRGSEDTNIILASHSRLILQAAKDHNYYNNWPDETRIQKIIDDGHEYWETLINCPKDKQIISKEEYDNALTIVETLRSHPHTSKYFFEKHPHLYSRNQVAIYFEYKGIKCKALLDRILIDKKNKRIQPLDLKTLAGSTKAFPTNVKKFKYYIQAAWYTLALQHEFPDYEILPFKFVVESSDSPGVLPLVFTVSPEYMDLGIEEYTEGIERYKWHVEHNHWDYDKEIYESNGELILEP
jgi:hypothetical protein